MRRETRAKKWANHHHYHSVGSSCRNPNLAVDRGLVPWLRLRSGTAARIKLIEIFSLLLYYLLLLLSAYYPSPNIPPHSSFLAPHSSFLISFPRTAAAPCTGPPTPPALRAALPTPPALRAAFSKSSFLTPRSSFLISNHAAKVHLSPLLQPCVDNFLSQPINFKCFIFIKKC